MADKNIQLKENTGTSPANLFPVTKLANVKLTDNSSLTTFSGTDGSGAGKMGLVPAPTANDGSKYLAGDGSWKSLPTIDSALSGTSTNAVQNKVVKSAIDAKYTKPSSGIPDSDLASGSAFVKSSQFTAFDSVKVISADDIGNWDDASSKAHSHSNKTVLDGISSTNVTNWGTAYTNSHTHSNKTTLDGITSTKVSNWETASANSHTHSNKSVIDGITSAKVTSWDNAASLNLTYTVVT